MINAARAMYPVSSKREIKKNKIATKVKLADLRHNSDLTRLSVVDEKALERKAKYEKAIIFLENFISYLHGT